MILKQNSVYPEVNFDASHKWSDLVSLSDDFLDQRGLERLVCALEGRCEGVIVEREYIDKGQKLETFELPNSKPYSLLQSNLNPLLP